MWGIPDLTTLASPLCEGTGKSAVFYPQAISGILTGWALTRRKLSHSLKEPLVKAILTGK